MTDRELLELAAKAADYQYMPANGCIVVDGIPGRCNPLDNDCDAMLLMVKMGLQVDVDLKKRCATAIHDAGDTVPCEWFDKDQQTPEEATRRVIVRAVAELKRTNYD